MDTLLTVLKLWILLNMLIVAGVVNGAARSQP